ncbi:glycerophosphodiester phosphodiesterase [Microbacterium sp. NPDC078428]|uniref:glycerophosphodiester phosphodiesterase n=1 Tax=Microbacterium sp. NPDC078428 TaxID=3364190 RepID=UPI0037CBD195
MPEPAVSARTERLPALIVMCVLVVAGVLVATLGASRAPVTASELLGEARDPGDAAFIAAHRGDSEGAPENTMPAVRAAIASGYEYVEVDIALTADGHAVLMHDATVDRTTDGRGAVAESTLAQIRGLDAGSWFGPDFAATPVPTAEEFLAELASSSLRALVELKGEWDADSVASLVATIARHGLERRVAVASFDARTLALVASQNTVISRLAILRQLPDDVVGAARALGVRGVIAAGREVLERPEVIDELHAAGMRVVVYTFNDDGKWREALRAGVDGIVTDVPARLADWLSEEVSEPR